MKYIIISLYFLFGLTQASWSVEKITLWPTILFLKAQDLCQFQDANGADRNELINQATQQLSHLIWLGADSQNALEIITTLDALVDKNRALARAGNGIDILLESSLKAYLDSASEGLNPENTRLQFVNQTSIDEFINALRENKRYDAFTSKDLVKVKGFVWGTYSYAPNCKGGLWVTIHVQLPKGESVSFQAQGKPELVMESIGLQMISHFQKTSFPTLIQMKDTFLVLVGAPGTSINKAPNPVIAEFACSMINARLPSLNEYDFLSILGNWSGGVSLGHDNWAISGNRVLAPDLRNPTPVRKHSDVNFVPVNFYCVK